MRTLIRLILVVAVLAVAAVVLPTYWPGAPWNRPGGGWEYPAFWGLIIVAIGLRGGGPYSLDRKLGREL